MLGPRPETVTVLFTDVVASTPWRTELGEAVADVRMAELSASSREIVEAHGGTVVKGLGDGVMATFTSAAAAVDAAAALQVVADRLSVSDDGPGLRIGISSGDMVPDGEDWSGAAAIEASRLCTECAGGTTLVAGASVQLSKGRTSHRLRQVGERVCVVRRSDRRLRVGAAAPSPARTRTTGSSGRSSARRPTQSSSIVRRRCSRGSPPGVPRRCSSLVSRASARCASPPRSRWRPPGEGARCSTGAATRASRHRINRSSMRSVRGWKSARRRRCGVSSAQALQSWRGSGRILGLGWANHPAARDSTRRSSAGVCSRRWPECCGPSPWTGQRSSSSTTSSGRSRRRCSFSGTSSGRRSHGPWCWVSHARRSWALRSARSSGGRSMGWTLVRW